MRESISCGFKTMALFSFPLALPTALANCIILCEEHVSKTELLHSWEKQDMLSMTKRTKTPAALHSSISIRHLGLLHSSQYILCSNTSVCIKCSTLCLLKIVRCCLS